MNNNQSIEEVFKTSIKFTEETPCVKEKIKEGYKLLSYTLGGNKQYYKIYESGIISVCQFDNLDVPNGEFCFNELSLNQLYDAINRRV